MKIINNTNVITTIENDLKVITFTGIVNTGDEIYRLYGQNAKKSLELANDSLTPELVKSLGLEREFKIIKVTDNEDYEDVGINVTYTYSFNDGSNIDYSCMESEFYCEDKDGSFISENEEPGLFKNSNIIKDTLAWKYFENSLIDSRFSDYAEQNNLLFAAYM